MAVLKWSASDVMAVLKWSASDVMAVLKWIDDEPVWLVGDDMARESYEMELEFRSPDGRSQKFWRVTVVETVAFVRWGRIGTTGQGQEKWFDSNGRARNWAIDMVDSKLRKGYVQKNSTYKRTGYMTTSLLGTTARMYTTPFVEYPTDLDSDNYAFDSRETTRVVREVKKKMTVPKDDHAPRKRAIKLDDD